MEYRVWTLLSVNLRTFERLSPSCDEFELSLRLNSQAIHTDHAKHVPHAQVHTAPAARTFNNNGDTEEEKGARTARTVTVNGTFSHTV